MDVDAGAGSPGKRDDAKQNALLNKTLSGPTGNGALGTGKDGRRGAEVVRVLQEACAYAPEASADARLDLRVAARVVGAAVLQREAGVDRVDAPGGVRPALPMHDRRRRFR